MRGNASRVSLRGRVLWLSTAKTLWASCLATRAVGTCLNPTGRGGRRYRIAWFMLESSRVDRNRGRAGWSMWTEVVTRESFWITKSRGREYIRPRLTNGRELGIMAIWKARGSRSALDSQAMTRRINSSMGSRFTGEGSREVLSTGRAPTLGAKIFQSTLELLRMGSWTGRGGSSWGRRSTGANGRRECSWRCSRRSSSSEWVRSCRLRFLRRLINDVWLIDGLYT